MEKLLLGIDIGTSACKVAVFDLAGEVVASASNEYPVYYPQQDYVEQNPDEWYLGVCNAIQSIMMSGKVNPKQIVGIGIDGQSWSCIPVDKNGKVLHNAMIWMDRRSTKQSEEVLNKIGFDRIFNVSGNLFDPSYTTPKILWLKENRPDIYKNTHKFLQSNSYIAYKLTGKLSQDVSQGYGVHAFNIGTGKWDDALCDEIGIDRSMLPEIFPCHQVIGEISGIAAKETGLQVGTPVVAGGLDAACGTLGAGVVKVGQTQEQGGQAGGMSICASEPYANPKLILSYHVIPDLWLLQGGTVGGGSLKWFKQELGAYETAKERETGVNAFQIMDDEAKNINIGSDGLIFLPYMAGERSPIWDKNAKGIYYGMGYNKTRAHMIRATLEGCAFALQHNLKTAEQTGVLVQELNAMGGAANSRLWTQIKSDVTGKVIKVPTSDTATTLGAAILAGVGVGAYKNFEQAVSDTIHITRVHEPDMKAHLLYQNNYQIYLEIYEKLKDTFKK